MLLLLAGNVMEPSSIVLIMAPILFPVAMKLGINPVHFGIMMTVNMEVGMCHPPVGLNLYVASGIAKMGITELTVAVWPWLITMLRVPGDGHLLARAVALAAPAPGTCVGRRPEVTLRGSETLQRRWGRSQLAAPGADPPDLGAWSPQESGRDRASHFLDSIRRRSEPSPQ